MARPREFNYDQVVLKVTDLFRAKGFHATSMDEITKATGLKKGSLYSAFGNKEALFRLALRKYIGEGPFERLQLDPPPSNPIEALVSLYRQLIRESQVANLGKNGCLAFNSGLEFGNQRTKLSRFVLQEVDRLEGFFRELIEEAKASGFLSKDLDTRKATFRVFAAAFTIREMAKFRPDRELLIEIANSALESLGTDKRL